MNFEEIDEARPPNMINVLCLAEMYPNSFNFYPGSFIHRQNRGLMEKGVGIKVISPVSIYPFPRSRRSRWWNLNRIPKHEVLDGIEVCHPRRLVIPKKFGFHFNGFLYYRSIGPSVKKLLSEGFDFHIIHAHVALPDGIAGALLGNEIQRPLVITTHGKDTANAQWSTVHHSPHCKKAIFKALRDSAKIVAVSGYVKQSILEIYPGMDSKKIVVIHGGVDSYENLHQGKRHVDTNIILSVGALIPLKGHDVTIDAMSRVVKIFPNSRLIIVGEGEEKHNLVRRVEKAGLQNFVNFFDNLPHDRLLKLMAMSDIFVLPSWAEGLGIVYLEAMGLGLPVIGCKGQGIEDIVSHRKTGLLSEPKNSEDLSNLILTLLKDEKLRVQIGKSGQKVVLGKYRWEDNAAKHIQLYRSLVAKQNNSFVS